MATKTKTNPAQLRARQDRLRTLARDHVSPSRNSGAEDVGEYLPEGFGPYRPGEGESVTPIEGAWAAITQGGEFGYVYPGFATKQAAQDRAVEYSGDLTYAELPIAVANLDSGVYWFAHFDRMRVRWTRGPKVERTAAPVED